MLRLDLWALLDLLKLEREQGDLAQLHDRLGKTNSLPALGKVCVVQIDTGTSLRLRHLQHQGEGQLYLVEDVSPLFERELQLTMQGRDIQQLFENAPYGIYRSTLTGQPIRCNPAMLRMNGYETLDELYAAIIDTGKSWYVDPQQRVRFLETLERDGMIADFVSEVHLYNSQSTMWVSETAWLVDDLDLGIRVIEGTAIDANQRVQQEKALRLAANTDWLTGLANRAAFHAHITDEIESAARTQQPLAVLLLDLDRFKDVNDIFGHSRGDLLLVELAKRLQAVVPANSFLARLGDEFGVVLHVPEHEALAIGEAINNTAATAYRLEGSEHVVGASAGVAVYPQHADSALDLLKAADLALYRCKKAGGGQVMAYESTLAAEKTKQAMLIRDLRDAHLRDELKLHYQPIVDARSGKVMGYEALMRWDHPARGLVMPNYFIETAEKAGFMVSFGNWAIEEGCRYAATLPAELKIAVNVSAVQFYSSDLLRVVEQALLKHGVQPARLELEVTESFILINETLTYHVLGGLRQLGVSIVLDDFGTGYSSLSYLQRFNFDKVKIDKSFVRELKSNAVNAAIVKAVLAIGRDLGLAVVAEGIETEVERDDLLSVGCPYFQGYLYGRPRPADHP